VFYALDRIRGKGQELARQEIASGSEIVESTGIFPPTARAFALATPEGPPARIRILSLASGTLQDIRVAGWFAFQSMEWPADGRVGLWLADQPQRTPFFLLIRRDTHTRCVKPPVATLCMRSRLLTATVWLSWSTPLPTTPG
jgi:hypothetical protein